MHPSESWSSLWAMGALPTENWHLPSTSTKIKSWPLPLLTFNFPERSSGWKSGMRLCALGKKTVRTGLQIDLFKKRLYESQILHLLITRETLTSLTVKSALAIKEKFTIKSPNRAATVQTSWEITRWCYGCTFRLDLVLLNAWDFWVVSSLDATILKTMCAGH